jgi:hypothetical protein
LPERLVLLDANLAMHVMELMTLVTAASSGDRYEVDPAWGGGDVRIQ